MTQPRQDPFVQLEWRHRSVPFAPAFDDPYYSTQDGLAESRHVFLAGNKLPHRFHPGFHIAELGFGTGLNLLCALDAWQKSAVKGPLQFTSFEAYPMGPDDRRQALSNWPELDPLIDALAPVLRQGNSKLINAQVSVEIIFGDARETLPVWKDKADAWFLDGFNPAKNPELWQPDLMKQVAEKTNTGGSFATYTAAGHVRRSLSDAGFHVSRQSGFQRKRHMTTGFLA